MTRRRVGVFGGTFDPVHFGHLSAANGARHLAHLDHVLFVPAGDPPHKARQPVSPVSHRLAMLSLALDGLPAFRISRAEIDRPGPHFTVDTMHLLQAEQPDQQLLFVTGMDSFLELESWRDYRTLLSQWEFLVVSRPGYARRRRWNALASRLGPNLMRSVSLLEIPGVAVASKILRQYSAGGFPLDFLTPAPVLAYIVSQGLYGYTNHPDPASATGSTFPGARGQTGTFDWPHLEQMVAERLKDRRWRHVRRVVETALHLATVHDVDADQVRAAALLHDYMRGTPAAELQALAAQFHVAEPDPADNVPEILHGPVAAAQLAATGLVCDPGILGAIRWHTTGRSHMSRLEMVVWLADKIEPGRAFPRVDRVRQQAESDLEGAMLDALEGSIQYLVDRGQRIHLATVQCRNWLLEQRQATSRV